MTAIKTPKSKAMKDQTKKEYEKIFLRFAEIYPKLFSKEEPKPLKVGIHNDIISDNQLDLSATKIRQFLKRYCSKWEYRNILVLETARYNLHGLEDGIVTQEHLEGKEKARADAEKKKKEKVMTKNNTNVTSITKNNRPKLGLAKPNKD